MAVNPFQYVKNVGKSFGYSAIDSLKNSNPQVAALASGAKDISSELYESIKDFKGGMKNASKDEKGLFALGKSTVKDFRDNLFEDLKTGNWYNKERMDEADMAMAKDMGFDFDDFDMDFDFDDEDMFNDDSSAVRSSTAAQTQSAESIVASMNMVGSKSVEAISNATVRSADYIVEANNQSSKALYSLQQRGFMQMSNGLAAIDSKLTAMVSMAQPLTQHMQNSATFYTKSTEYQQQVLQKLDILIKNTTIEQPKNSANRKTTLSDLMTSEGTLDLGRYFDFVKGNFKNSKDNSMMSMMLDMFGGSLNGLSKKATASPMKLVTDAVTNVLIPQMMQESMKEFNKALGNFFPAAIDKLQKTDFGANGGIFGSLFEMVKDMFLPADTLKKSIKTGNYNHGQTVWTGESEMALKEVIPTYLSAITAALTGNPMTQYDYSRGAFVTRDNVKNLYNSRMQRAANSSGGDFRNDTRRAISSLNMDQNTKNALLQEVDNFFLYSFEKGSASATQIKNKDFNYTEYGISQETLKLLREVLKMYEENNTRGRAMEWASNVRTGRDRYNAEIERAESENGVERSVFDNSSILAGGKGSGGRLLGVDQYGHDVFYYLQGIWRSNWYLADNIGLFGSSAGGGGTAKGGSTIFKKPKYRKARSIRNRNDVDQVENTSNLFTGKSVSEINQETMEQFAQSIKDSITGEQPTRKAGEKSTKEANAAKEENINLSLLGLATEEDTGPSSSAKRAAQNVKDTVDNSSGGFKAAFRKIQERVSDIFATPAKIFSDVLNAGQTSLYNMIFGREGENEKGLFGYFFEQADNLFIKFNDFFDDKAKATMHKFMDWLTNGSLEELRDDIVNNLKGAGRWIGNRIGGALGFGKRTKPGEGETEPISNGTAAYGRRVTKTGVVAVSEGELIIPSEYNPFYRGSNNKSRQMRNERNALRRYYGSFAEGGTVGANDNNVIFDLPKTFSASIGKLFSGIQQVFKSLVPDNPEDEEENVHKLISLHTASELKKAGISDEIAANKGAVGAGALAGTGISLLTGAVVGPLAGAAIGASVGLVIKSEKVQHALFGDVDENGDRTGNILSKEVSNLITKKIPNTALAAGAGGIAGLFMGSPIMGAIIGGTIGFASQSDKVKAALFGTEESDSGLISKAMQEKLKAAMPNMGAGAIAGLLLGPFGIVGNVIVGSAVGYASTTEKFQDMILGKRDEKTGQRTGGIVGEFRGYFFGFEDEKGKHRQGIFESVVGIFNKVGEEIRVGARDLFKDTTKKLRELVDRAAKSTLGQWLGGTRVGRAVSAVGRGARRVINAPFRLAQRGLESIDVGLGRHAISSSHNMRNGLGRNMTAQERNAWAEEHGMETEGQSWFNINNLLAGMDENQLEGLDEDLANLEDPTKVYDQRQARQAREFAHNLQGMGIDPTAAKKLEKEVRKKNNRKSIEELLDDANITDPAQRQAITDQYSGIKQTIQDRTTAEKKAQDTMKQLQEAGIDIRNARDVRAFRDQLNAEKQGRFGVSTENKELTTEEETLEVEKSIGSDVDKIVQILAGGSNLSDEERKKIAFGTGKFDAKQKTCPQCGATIDAKASKCPKCGYDFAAAEAKKKEAEGGGGEESANTAKEAVDNTKVPGEKETKECPNCHEIVDADANECPECHYQFNKKAAGAAEKATVGARVAQSLHTAGEKVSQFAEKHLGIHKVVSGNETAPTENTNTAKEAVNNATTIPESSKSENETTTIESANPNAAQQAIENASIIPADIGGEYLDIEKNIATDVNNILQNIKGESEPELGSGLEAAENIAKESSTDMFGNKLLYTTNEQGEPVPDMQDKETRETVEENKQVKAGFMALAGVGTGITGLTGVFGKLKEALFGSEDGEKKEGLFSKLFDKFLGDNSFLGGLFNMVSGIFGGPTASVIGKTLGSAVSKVVGVVGGAGLIAAVIAGITGKFDDIVGNLTGGRIENHETNLYYGSDGGLYHAAVNEETGEEERNEAGEIILENGETAQSSGIATGSDSSLSTQLKKNIGTSLITGNGSVAGAAINKGVKMITGTSVTEMAASASAAIASNGGMVETIMKAVAKFLEYIPELMSRVPILSQYADAADTIVTQLYVFISDKVAGSAAVSGISKFFDAISVAAPYLRIAFAVVAAGNAAGEAEQYFEVAEATTAQKVIAALVGGINAFIPYIGNLIPNKVLIEFFVSIAPKIGLDMSSLEQQKAELQNSIAGYNEMHGTSLNTEEYLEQVENKGGFVRKTKNAVKTAKNWVVDKTSNLVESAKNLGSNIAEGATNIKNKVVETAGNVKDKVVGGVTNAKNKVVEGVTNVATSVGDWVTDKKNKAVNAVHSVSDKVVEKFTSIGDIVNEEKEYMDEWINDTSIPWTEVFHVEDDPDNPMGGLVKNFRLGVRIGYFAFMLIKRLGKIVGDKISGVVDTVKTGVNDFMSNETDMARMAMSGDPKSVLEHKYQGSEDNPLNGVLGAASAFTKVYALPVSCVTWLGKKISDAIGTAVDAVKTGYQSFSTNQSQMMELVNSGDPGEVLNYTYQRDENDPLGGVFSALSSVTKVGLVPVAGVKWLGNKISDAISAVIETVTSAWQTYQGSMDQAKDYALAGDTEGLSGLEYEGNEENPLNGVFKFIFGFNKLGWSAVGTVVHVAKSIAEAIGNVIDNVKSGYQTLSDNSDSLKTSAFDGDIEGVTGATFQGNEENPLNGVFSFIFGVEKIIYTPVAAVKHVANVIGDFISSKVDAAKNDYSVLTQAGDQMGNLAKNGDVSGVMGTTFQSSSDNILGPIYGAIFNIQKIFYAATAVGQKIFGTVGDIVSSVTGWVGGIASGVKEAAGNVVNSARNLISGGNDEEVGAGSGIRREPRYVGGASGMDDNFVSQVDGKYRNTKFAGSTVGNIGCGPAVATMLMNTSKPGSMTMRKAIDETKGYQTPTGTDSAYFGNLLSKNGMSADYYSGTDKDSVRNIEAELAMGRPTVLLGRDPYNTDKAKSPFGPTEHYVMATGIDNNGNIIVNDPEAKKGGAVYKPDILNNISLGISTDGAPGNDDDITGLTGGAFNVVDTANSQAVWSYFIGRGFSPAATAGIMGNIYQESGFKPEIIQGGGKGPAAGLFQWENYNTKSARWASMKKFADKRGKDWTDLETQLKYGDNEFTNELKDEVGETGWVASSVKSRYGSIDAFKNLTDYKEATKGFEETFERAGKPAMENRYEAAKQYYNLYSNGGATSTLGSTQVADPYFIKYTLTDTEIKQLANLATQEQGSTKGAAAEASIMANLWERDQKNSKYKSLYDYVRNSGWFAHAAQYMDNGPASGITSDATIDAVKQVLNEGKRTIPGYIDEHDCFSDFDEATNNGTPLNPINDRSQYQKDVTKLHNVNGSSWTFWGFPDTASDPFGYTDANRTRSGVEEGYYNLDGSVAYNPNGGTSGSSGSESGSSSSGFSGILNTILSAFASGFAKILGGGGNTSSESSGASYSSSSGTSGGEGTDQQKELVNVLTPYVGKLSYDMNGPRNPEKGSADCSSTVNWAYKKVLNDSIGDNTGSMLSSSKTTWVDWPSPAVSKKNSAATSGGPNINNLMPGDILLYTRPNSSSGYNAGRDFAVGHVEMYMGDGNRLGHGSGIGPKITPYNNDSARYIGAKRHNSFLTSTPPAATEAASAGAGSGLLPSVTKIKQTAPVNTGKFRRFVGGASGVDDEEEEEETRRRRSSSSSSDNDTVISLLRKILKATQSIAENTTDIPTLGTTLTNYCQAQLSTEVSAVESDLAKTANNIADNAKVNPEDDPALQDLMYTLGEIARG